MDFFLLAFIALFVVSFVVIQTIGILLLAKDNRELREELEANRPPF